MKGSATATLVAKKPIVSLPCACANLRRASRIVTQLYDEELRRAGMRVTQFTLLQALIQMENASQGGMADVLGLDSTTLTRTLTLLRRKGWIQANRGEDRRQIRLTLTAEGLRQYGRAKPYWLSAHRRLQRALGQTEWKELISSTVRTAELAQKC